MEKTELASQTIHVSCVARNGCAILIAGASGAGKSDLALRLIDRGAILVSDDYTVLRREKGRLYASAPESIQGKIEVRGVGIIDYSAVSDIPVCLYVDLDGEVERLPDAAMIGILGIDLPAIALRGLEPSAPIKVEAALRHFGSGVLNPRTG